MAITQQRENNRDATRNTKITREHTLPLHRLPEFKKVYKLSLSLEQQKTPKIAQLKKMLNELKTKEALPLVAVEVQKNLPATELLKEVATLLEQLSHHPKLKEINPEKQKKKAVQKALQLLTTLSEQAQEQGVTVAEEQAIATDKAVAHSVVNDVPPISKINIVQESEQPEPEQEAYIEASMEQGYSKADSWDTATGEASSSLETAESKSKEVEPALQKGAAALQIPVKTSGQVKAPKGQKKGGSLQKLLKLFGKAMRTFKSGQGKRKPTVTPSRNTTRKTRKVVVLSEKMLEAFTKSSGQRSVHHQRTNTPRTTISQNTTRSLRIG